MEEIGLFPLGIVLLPGEQIPLHIFEDRYKELIGECIDAEREFGLVLSDPDGMRTVGTRARVEAVLERFDDGRMNIVVRGGERFSIAALTSGRAFSTAEATPYTDDDDAEEPLEEELARCLETFARLADAAEAESTATDPQAESVAFDLAGRIAFAPGPKQELLEMRTERSRVRRLIELMEEAEEALQRGATIRRRAAGNGHVASE